MENNFTANTFNLKISKNSIQDSGDGTISFKKPLVITDDSIQRNGTRYDIDSMDISEYSGRVTADHSYSITGLIGESFGLKKTKNKVTIDGIRFAVNDSELASFAYKMIKAGLLTDFSIETYGPYPDEENIYYKSKLIGLSAVLIGNNKNAAVQKLVRNSLKHGIDSDTIDKLLSSYQSNKFKKQEEKMTEEKKVLETKEKTETEKVDLVKAINEAITPINQKLEELEKKVVENKAKVEEPKFENTNEKTVTNSFDSMSWQDRTVKQIEFALSYFKTKNPREYAKLSDLNSFHLEKLQEKGIVSNSMTIADFGNFVISPELLSEIQGHRSDYSNILSVFPFQETLSTQMAWLTRSGDINMQEVEMCDDGADGNLKPISEYEATMRTANLHELAAVTPVCNAATRFLAADIIQDIARGYRNDFDRKKAQLIVARLQQAINSNGNAVTYATTSDLNSVKSWLRVLQEVSEITPNGYLIMNYSTAIEMLITVVGSGISGNVLSIIQSGQLAPILGKNTVVVPDDLLPTLNTSNTDKTFAVEGSNVTINKSVFYVDPSNWLGRTSGGLQFDLSTEAAYEVGGSVKSAYQRNELVMRGSFFRNGAIKDLSKVAALNSRGVS